MSASSYNRIKAGLTEVVQALSLTDISSGKQRLDELARKIDQEQFNLVVMGQFKRGKSTFINALLGAEIVPASIVPLTSVVTILRHGSEGRAVVHYLDGRQEQIRLEEIARFVTEKQNPKNKLGVKEVEVFYPSEYLKGGVCIVDTPGVGSVFQHNTDVAYAYLPYADAGIFLVTPDPPMGESEHRFLQDVREQMDKLFFVLNKVDLVDESDLAEALDFTADLLARDLGKSVSIWPLSAKLALAGKLNGTPQNLERSGFLPFERELEKFLHREKGRVFLQSVIASLLKLAADETMACRLEQEAARLSLDDLQDRIRQFEAFAREAEKARDRQEFILKGQIGRLHQLLDADLESLQRKELPGLLSGLEQSFQQKLSEKQSAQELEDRLQAEVFEAIKAVFGEFRRREAEKIAAELERIYLEVAAQTNDIIAGIVKATADLFQVELEPFTAVERLSGKSDFYFLLKDDPGMIDLIRLSTRTVLPLAVARKIILKRMQNTVVERFERHCGRVRYDLIRRIDRTSTEFRKNLTAKVSVTLDTIREALGRPVALKNQNEQEVYSTLNTLSCRLSEVDGIQQRMQLLQKQATDL